MRRRGRGRKASWEWSNTFTLVGVDTPAQYALKTWALADLLPQPRVDFLCEARGSDSLVHVETLLWLDFHWAITSGNGQPFTYFPPAVDFFIIKSTVEETQPTAFAGDYAPYAQPIVPSAITSWSSTATEDSDGLDPYLWTHHIDPFLCNSLITNVGISEVSGLASGQGNAQAAMAVAANQTAVLKYSNDVRMAWQPDVVVKAKRKVKKNEALKLGFTWVGANNGVSNNGVLSLTINHRTLLR